MKFKMDNLYRIIYRNWDVVVEVIEIEISNAKGTVSPIDTIYVKDVAILRDADTSGNLEEWHLNIPEDLEKYQVEELGKGPITNYPEYLL